MNRILIVSAFAVVIVATATIEWPSASDSVASGSISLLYVDTDVSGNMISQVDADGDTQLDAESTSLGPIDECREMAVSEEADIDIAIADWPAGLQLTGFETFLHFDPSVISISMVQEQNTLLVADPQSDPALWFRETFAAGDDVLELAASHYPVRDADEDIDSEETSAGYLARIHVTAVATGQSAISITAPAVFITTHTDNGRYVPVDQVNDGFISVGQPCVIGPQPGPPPPPPAPACATGLPDSDGDGYSNCAELYMGSDWSDPCVSALPRPMDGWPLDLVESGMLDISDLLALRDYFGGTSTPEARADFDTDGVLSILEMYLLLERFGETCTDVPPLPCATPPWWSYPPPWTLPAGDVDCDGFSSSVESTLGTNPDDDCGFTVGGEPTSETWPVDLVESNKVDISDVLALKPIFGQSVPPAAARYDLVPGDGISISDVLALKPFFNKSCPG